MVTQEEIMRKLMSPELLNLYSYESKERTSLENQLKLEMTHPRRQIGLNRMLLRGNNSGEEYAIPFFFVLYNTGEGDTLEMLEVSYALASEYGNFLGVYYRHGDIEENADILRKQDEFYTKTLKRMREKGDEKFTVLRANKSEKNNINFDQFPLKKD